MLLDSGNDLCDDVDFLLVFAWIPRPSKTSSSSTSRCDLFRIKRATFMGKYLVVGVVWDSKKDLQGYSMNPRASTMRSLLPILLTHGQHVSLFRTRWPHYGSCTWLFSFPFGWDFLSPHEVSGGTSIECQKFISSWMSCLIFELVHWNVVFFRPELNRWHRGEGKRKEKT